MPSNLERKARRKRQTRLTFDPVDPPDASSSPAPARMAPAKIRYKRPGKQSPSEDATDDSESDDVFFPRKSLTQKRNSKMPFKLLPTPVKSSQAQPSSKTSKNDTDGREDKLSTMPPKNSNNPIELSSDDSEEEIPAQPKNKQKKAHFGVTQVDQVETRVTRASVKDKKNKQLPPIDLSVDIGDDEDEDEDEDPIISSPRRSQRPIFKENVTIESDEDIRSSPPRRRRQVSKVEDEDKEPIVSPLKRRRLTTKSDEDSDSDISPSKRLRNTVGHNTSDDTDLSSSRTSTHKTMSPKLKTPQRHTRQQVTKHHRTEKEKNLELLRRRRLGEKIEQLTESGSESEEEDSDEFQELSEFEDEEDEENVLEVQKPSNGGGDSGSDFVVEDEEDGPLGIPDHRALIPLQFTQAAHKPLKEHFRDAVEWMVHNKINPGFDRDDEIYTNAFKKLHDECYGMAKSKFSSTQWTKEFTSALEARPYFFTDHLHDGEGISLDGLPKCDACNHRNHQPCCAIYFEGKPYDPKSLEELEQDSDDDDDDDDKDSDDSSMASVNINGQYLPNQSKRWSAGPVCKANAEQAHALHHWKFALNELVVQVLEQDGELEPQKLVEREKMKRKKRTEYANRVVDNWGTTRRIKDLWSDFKNMTGTARGLQEVSGRRGGWK